MRGWEEIIWTVGSKSTPQIKLFFEKGHTLHPTPFLFSASSFSLTTSDFSSSQSHVLFLCSITSIFFLKNLYVIKSTSQYMTFEDPFFLPTWRSNCWNLKAWNFFKREKKHGNEKIYLYFFKVVIPYPSYVLNFFNLPSCNWMEIHPNWV